MKRVMIVGGPGSGKSTLARLLGDKTGLPIFHMDHIHWKSGWVHRDAAEKDVMVAEVYNQDAWVFEGGHSRSYPERLARADTFIWLDVPFRLRFWRILRRTLMTYGRNRPDLPDGCPEKIDSGSFEFWRWAWDTRHNHRDKLLEIINNPPKHLKLYHFKTLKEVRAYLYTISKM